MAPHSTSTMASSALPHPLRIGVQPTSAHIHRHEESPLSSSLPARFPRALSRAPTPSLPSEPVGKPWRDRKQTYIAQTLILFNVTGTLLSSGPYLEYLYNSSTLKTSSLLQISSIFATQILTLFAIPMPTRWLYQRGWLRIPASASIALMCASQLIPLWCTEWWHLFLVRGVIQGIAMGSLTTLGTLSTASHYRNNIPYASMLCWSFGILGAVVYTAIAHFLLQDARWNVACYVNFGMSVGTLPPVISLLRGNGEFKIVKMEVEVKGSGSAEGSEKDRELGFRRPTGLLLTGFLLTTAGLLTYPLYLPLVLSNSSPGSHAGPSTATLHLILLLFSAIPSLILATSFWWRRRFGAMDSWTDISCLAGACYVVLGWMPYITVSWVVSVVFGICFGMMLPLVVKVAYTVVLLGRGRESVSSRGTCSAKSLHLRVGLLLLGAGSIAAATVVLTALGVEVSSAGFKWSYTVVGAIMVAGGLCMVSERVWITGWQEGKWIVV